MSTVHIKCLIPGCNYAADESLEPIKQWHDVSGHYTNAHIDNGGVTRLQRSWAELENLLDMMVASEGDDFSRLMYKHMARGYAMCFTYMLPHAKNNNWTPDRISAHVYEIWKARKNGESIPPTPGVNGGMRIESGSVDTKNKLAEKAPKITAALNAGMTVEDLALMYKTTVAEINKAVDGYVD